MSRRLIVMLVIATGCTLLYLGSRARPGKNVAMPTVHVARLRPEGAAAVVDSQRGSKVEFAYRVYNAGTETIDGLTAELPGCGCQVLQSPSPVLPPGGVTFFSLQVQAPFAGEAQRLVRVSASGRLLCELNCGVRVVAHPPEWLSAIRTSEYRGVEGEVFTAVMTLDALERRSEAPWVKSVRTQLLSCESEAHQLIDNGAAADIEVKVLPADDPDYGIRQYTLRVATPSTAAGIYRTRLHIDYSSKLARSDRSATALDCAIELVPRYWVSTNSIDLATCGEGARSARLRVCDRKVAAEDECVIRFDNTVLCVTPSASSNGRSVEYTVAPQQDVQQDVESEIQIGGNNSTAQRIAVVIRAESDRLEPAGK